MNHATTQPKKILREADLAGAGIDKIHRSDEFATLLLPLADCEQQLLRDDLLAHGLLHPIVIDELGHILDGHHRHALCKELAIEARFKPMRNLSYEEKIELVYSLNMDRRQMSPDQFKEAWRRRRENLEKLREANPQKYTDAYIGAKLGQSPDASRKRRHRTCPYEKLDGRVKIPRPMHAGIKQRADAGEAIERIAAEFGVAKSTISKVVKKQAEKEAELARYLDADPNPEVDFRLGDFKEILADLAPGSIDAIITDPPYGREYLDLWGRVAEFAAEKLKPSGMFVAYTGVMHLPEVLDQLRKHLDFYWLGAIALAGHKQIITTRSVRVCHRPFIVCRPKNAPRWDHDAFPDLIEGGKIDKVLHPWQQALSEFETLVNLFTEPGHVVVDPFACTGTTLIAAHRAGRVAIGAEIDPDAHAIGVGRVGRETATGANPATAPITLPEKRQPRPASVVGTALVEV